MRCSFGDAMTRKPFALVSVGDRDCRACIVESLTRLGWTVVEHASGFHLVQALSDVIIGDHTSLRPALIVVDALSPGCSGVTIAAGFRDLGIHIRVIVIGPGEPAAAAFALVALAKPPAEPAPLVAEVFHVA
jgi:CheY-like chemotaxis protein